MKGKILSTAVAVFRDERVNRIHPLKMLKDPLKKACACTRAGQRKGKKKHAQLLYPMDCNAELHVTW